MCKTKKMLAVVLALIMTFSMFAGIGFTAIADNDADLFKYEINNGEATITECVETAQGNIVIPDTIEGCPVTAIGDNAFYFCNSVTSITIPEGVTTIGAAAFSSSQRLVSINIPASVTSIADGAFSQCKALETVAVDTNNQYYTNGDDGVVFNKDKTVLVLYPAGKKDTSYAIPDSVTTIGAYAFYYARNLKNVYFTDNITAIGKMAFYSSGVEGIIIPDTVTDIAFDAFSCASIKSIILPDGVTETLNFNGSGLKSIFIPASVNKINEGAFFVLQNFTDIYYAGSEEAWNKIEFEEFKMADVFENVTIHYSSCNEIVIQSKENEISINTVKSNDAFKQAVKNSKYTLTDVYGKELAADVLVGTGCIVKIYDADANLTEMKQIVVNGDVNGDGKITTVDARLALRAAVNLDKLNGLCTIAADIDGVAGVTTADARKILRKAAGLE